VARSTGTKQPSGNDGVVDIQVTGDSVSVDKMVDGLMRAFSETAITYNFLQDRVYPILADRAERRFASHGDEAVGGAWAQLRPFTQEMRAQGGFGPTGPINVRTGAMKRHILQREPEAIPMPTGGTLYFPRRGGREEAKVKVAQMGEMKSRTVPRPVLAVSHVDMELILVALGVHIAQNQNGAGLGGF